MTKILSHFDEEVLSDILNLIVSNIIVLVILIVVVLDLVDNVRWRSTHFELVFWLLIRSLESIIREFRKRTRSNVLVLLYSFAFLMDIVLLLIFERISAFTGRHA